MRINKSKFRWLPRVNVTKGYMNIRGWRVAWLGFEIWHTEERRTMRGSDGALICSNCGYRNIGQVCTHCGFVNTPRRTR